MRRTITNVYRWLLASSIVLAIFLGGFSVYGSSTYLSGSYETNINVVYRVVEINFGNAVKEGVIKEVGNNVYILSPSLGEVTVSNILWRKIMESFGSGTSNESLFSNYMDSTGLIREGILDIIDPYDEYLPRIVISGSKIMIVDSDPRLRHIIVDSLRDIVDAYIKSLINMSRDISQDYIIKSFDEIEIVYIISPIDPYIHLLHHNYIIERFESLNTTNMVDFYMRYGFTFGGVGGETQLGTYNMYVFLSCNSDNISYSYDTIDELIPKTERFISDLVGDKPFIVYVSPYCTYGDWEDLYGKNNVDSSNGLSNDASMGYNIDIGFRELYTYEDVITLNIELYTSDSTYKSETNEEMNKEVNGGKTTSSGSIHNYQYLYITSIVFLIVTLFLIYRILKNKFD